MGFYGIRTGRAAVLVWAALVPTVAPAQSGYVHGADHCYSFRTPSGWQADNQAGVHQGVPMVFYPLGSTWHSAPIAMYTRPAQNQSADSTAIGTQIRDVIDMYRRHSQMVVANQIGEVETADGVTGELWSFSGYRDGNTEFAVYFLGRTTVNFFVAQVSGGAGVEGAQRALVELASSYREEANCKPCDGAPSCDGAN